MKDEGGTMKDEGGRMKDEGGRITHPSSFIPHPFLPRRRGSAILELSLILPGLLTLALLAVDYGRVATCYVAVTNAARAGAGYGSSNAYTSATQAAWQAATIQAATDEFATNPWYNAANLTVSTPVVTQEGNGYWRVSVTATYSFQTLINWTLLSNYHKPVSLTRTVVMRATI